MKLVMVLMLTALPLYCYAGSGCSTLEQVIDEIMDSNVTKTQFVQDFQEFIPGEATADAVMKVKQCFLDQNEETLDNVRVMRDTIYHSFWCAKY